MVQLAQAELALALAKQPYTDTDFEMARARIAQAEAAVEMANQQMYEATIHAPFDGVVAELYVTQGTMVGPQAPVALFVSQKVEAVFNVEESRIGQVKEGQNAALRVAAYPGQDFPGVVTSIAPAADKDSHTFVVKVTPAEPPSVPPNGGEAGGWLRSGMYADLSLLVEQKEATLLVPRSAVSDPQGDGQQTVYVVLDDATVKQQAVTIGLEDGDRLEVLSGLTAGQQVVVAGQSGLEDGARVEVTNSEF
jgi:membrane fusion protein (multidrug efflux system)